MQILSNCRKLIYLANEGKNKDSVSRECKLHINHKWFWYGINQNALHCFMFSFWNTFQEQREQQSKKQTQEPTELSQRDLEMQQRVQEHNVSWMPQILCQVALYLNLNTTFIIQVLRSENNLAPFLEPCSIILSQSYVKIRIMV